MSGSPKSGSSARGPGRPAGARAGGGRELLLDAARGLMAERGFPRVTAREVAERAGVRPALVNYYFGGRDGLLRAVVEGVAGSLRARILSSALREGTPRERLRGMVREWVSALAEDPYVARLMVEQVLFAEPHVIDGFVERFARPNLEVIRGVLAEGRDAGELRPLDPLLLVPGMVGVCMFFFLAAPVVERLFGVDPRDPELARRFADSAADLLLEGISTRPEEGA